MNLNEVINNLPELNDSDVFRLLNAVSDDVKRRNGLLGPKNLVSSKDIYGEVKAIAEALTGRSE